jgi:hypothetical protein
MCTCKKVVITLEHGEERFLNTFPRMNRQEVWHLC